MTDRFLPAFPINAIPEVPTMHKHPRKTDVHVPYPEASRMMPATLDEPTVHEPAVHDSREKTMKSGAKDKAEGLLHEAKGKIKEVAGKISGKPDLESSGIDEKNRGKVQEKIGQIKTVLGK